MGKQLRIALRNGLICHCVWKLCEGHLNVVNAIAASAYVHM